MDKTNFNSIVARFLEKFEYTNGLGPDEWFKWRSIDCFQANWNIDADNLLESFNKSMAKCSVLLDGSHSTPSQGISALLRIPGEVEFVRSAFRDLFAPGDRKKRDLQVEKFDLDVNSRLKKYWPNDKIKQQTIRGTLCYLTLAQPGQNYFYMYKRAKNWSIATDFGWDLGSGGNFSLPTYYLMCDELVEEISKSSELKQCNDLRREKAGISFDDNYHTLAYDIIYCATTYHLYRDIPIYYPADVKSRIQRRMEQEQIERLKEEKIIAEKNYAEFETYGCLPPKLVGKEVSHKKFGKGIIETQTGKIVSVRFDDNVIKLGYPEAFIQKHLTIADSEMSSIQASNDFKKKQEELTKNLKQAQAAYDKSVSAFNTKWKRAVHNELIDESDED